jgi:histidinol dehydrogenase
MKFIKYPKRSTWPEILKRPLINNSELEKKVSGVLSDIKINSDAAVKKYTLQFDGVRINNVQVSKQEIKDAAKKISPELKKAIRIAYKNILAFHNAQKESIKKIETMPGVTCWRKSVGIEKAGLYIPGGSAPLFSTVLMLGIPARIAGCKEVILCTPSDKKGKINPAILFAADLTGIKKIYRLGGAQAIGAMAYGTQTIKKVSKIFGPGNQYVTCAKQLVNKEGTAIDIPAGPSELVILADDSAVPSFVAADLLSQAEHGIDSQVLLVSTSLNLIKAVKEELKIQLSHLPRKITAQQSLNNSKAILVKDMKTAIELVNEYAPEHLIINCRNESRLADLIINAGSLFLGNYTPESAGDYASGTNHTLPTNGFAKAYSGVSLDSFVRKITVQRISAQGLQNIGNTIEVMAEAEQLEAHKNAVSIRLKNLKEKK